MADDPYKVLGVEKTASQDEIRKAYRKLAKDLHPDLNPGDDASAERFKAVASAYDIIGDAETRARYDNGEIDASGQERPQQQAYREYASGPGGERYRHQGSYQGFEDASDIFADLFRNRGGAQGFEQEHYRAYPMPGRDARYALEVDFLDAARGQDKRITLPDGSVLNVSVPAGVSDGQTIRLKGKGEPGLNGAPDGDALINISVRPHPLYQRDGDNIRIILPIGLDEAMLGAKVEVPTLHGRVKVSVPEGASSGQTLRLKGRGIRRKSGKQGDQLVELKLVMPDTPDEELKAAVEAWKARATPNARANWAGNRET